MKEPVDHIQRQRLPWRQDSSLTECGLDATKVPSLTQDEFFARVEDLGKQRTALFTCMTCIETLQRWSAMSVASVEPDDPRPTLGREIEWECGRWGRQKRGHRLLDELRAISALVENHRDEFDAHVREIEQRREWNEKKAAMQHKPKTAAKPTGIL